MLETYVRQGKPAEQLEAVPAPPREPRKVLPGVRTLAVIDPTSGEQAQDGAELTVVVHAVSSVAIPTRRGHRLLVQYACTTVEGARIDVSHFIDTENPTDATRAFFGRRGLAVKLPSAARTLTWALKDARRPNFVVARKAGKYWNCLSELW